MCQKLLVIISLLMFPCFIKAQDFDFLNSENVADQAVFGDTILFNSFNIKQNLRKQLISLDSILIIAEKNHPEIKFQEALVQKAYYNLADVKNMWMQSIAGFANASSGNQFIRLNNAQGLAENQNISNGYQVGIGVRLPLYEVLGRKPRVRKAQEEYKAAGYQKDKMQLLLNEQIIRTYFYLTTVQEMMIVMAREVETQQLNLQLAEKKVLKGQMQMANYSTISKTASDVIEKYQQKKQEFYSTFYIFERLIGVKMIELKRKG